MTKLKVLIVDDMPISRARLRRILAEDGAVEIVGECGDAAAALAVVAAEKPDLLFLDVQMPGMSGLDLVARLPNPRPAIIFVTAFEEFAVQAFAAEAVDYLLKPFDRTRLEQALAKVRKVRGPALPANGSTSVASKWLERIAVKSVGRIDYVETIAVDWIEAAGNYLSLHCGAGSYLVRQTMNQIEQELDPASFVRIHRSAMVRITAIASVEPLFNGDRALTLKDGTKLTLSRSFRDKARAALGEI